MFVRNYVADYGVEFNCIFLSCYNIVSFSCWQINFEIFWLIVFSSLKIFYFQDDNGDLYLLFAVQDPSFTCYKLLLVVKFDGFFDDKFYVEKDGFICCEFLVCQKDVLFVYYNFFID